MTDTSTVNRRNNGQHARGASDRPRSGGGFNPLHPSMELPPEQLIRLLGLEDKKARKKKPGAAASARTGARAGATASREPVAKTTAKPVTDADRAAREPRRSAPEPPAPMWAEPAAGRSHRKRSRRHGKAAANRKKRSGLGLAAVIGGLAGVAVSVYLFWSPSTPDTIAKPAPAAAQQAPANKTPAPAVASVPARTPVNRVQDKPAGDIKSSPRLEAREQQLRAAAERRFREHMQETQRLPPRPAPDANTIHSEPARTPQAPMAATTGAPPAGTAIPQADTQAGPAELTEPMVPEPLDPPAEPDSAPTAESLPSPLPAAPASTASEASPPQAEPPLPAPEATIDPAASLPPAATQPLANPEPLSTAQDAQPDVAEPAQPGAQVPAPGATRAEPAADENQEDTGGVQAAPPPGINPGEADPPASF